MILVVGSSGFLGSALVRGLGAIGADRKQIDLSLLEDSSVDEILAKGFSHVAICAANTDIESCFKNPAEAHLVNVTGTIQLLEKIKQSGAVPIFFSTDYVFTPSEQPLSEDDEKKPQTLYGRQKLEVERYIESHFEKYLIFRTSKLMAKSFHAKNILQPVVRSLKEQKSIRLFEDQWLNPVFVEDIAAVVKKASESGLSGTFHLGTRKIYSRAEIGRVIADFLGLSHKLLKPGYMKDVKTSEPRPHCNTLNCEKVEKALEFRFTELAEGLKFLSVELRRPSLELLSSYFDFVEEMRLAGEKIWEENNIKNNESETEFVERLLRAEVRPAAGLVAETHYWACEGDQVVGRIALRHVLNASLEEFGGHIGYEVRPGCRMRGLAKEMLSQLLQTERAKEIGNVLLTCAPDNFASNRTIIANGGVLAKTAYVERWKRDTNYYWIKLQTF